MLDELDSFSRKILALFHIIQVNLFVVEDIHNKVHDLNGFEYSFGVVDDPSGDDVHALHVAELGVEVVEVNEDLAQEVSVAFALESRVAGTCARDVFFDLFEGLNLLVRQVHVPGEIGVGKGYDFIAGEVFPNVVCAIIEGMGVIVNVFHQTLFGKVGVAMDPLQPVVDPKTFGNAVATVLVLPDLES